MTKEDVFQRIVDYTIRITKMIDHLPEDVATGVISEQILRAAFSEGVSYRQTGRDGCYMLLFSQLRMFFSTRAITSDVSDLMNFSPVICS